jgi:hypothetical protein
VACAGRAGRGHGRRPRAPATEVDRQDGPSLSAAQILPVADKLSRLREDQAAILLSGDDHE